jgi:Leucine-rich repeat (LRR) protein
VIDMRQADGIRNSIKKRKYDEFFNGSLLSNYFNTFKRHLSSQNNLYLRTEALASMTKLKILGLNYVKLIGNYGHFPKGVVWLCLHGFPLDYLPRELALENVVSLDLRYSRLKQVWKKTPFLESLKILDISYSERLERTPNFRGIPNLERLILKGCVSLVEVCESIGNLEMLEFLDLSDCKMLQKLPRNMQKIGSLTSLNMSGCNIKEFPSEVRDMKPLQTMKQALWSMMSIPKKGPQTLWDSLPFSLRVLSLSGCNLSDDSFPDSFGNMPSLLLLDLSKNPFRRLPNGLKSITGRLNLCTNFCEKLQLLDFDGLHGHSIDLSAIGCSSLEKVTSLDHVSHHLSLSACSKLDEREFFF